MGSNEDTEKQIHAPSTPLFTVANEVLAAFFKAESATNYFAHEIEDLDTGELYIITMQKVTGETPLHQLNKAKDRIAFLEHGLKQTMDLACRNSENFGAARQDVVDRAKEALNVIEQDTVQDTILF